VSEDPLDLAGRAALGDGHAVDLLLEHHLPALHAFVRAHMGLKLRARESTSDLVQSVCRELLSHQERFRYPTEGAFRTWLFTTARRKIANRARDLDRDKRAVGRELGGLDEAAVATLGGAYASISSPSGRALRKEEIARLESAIDALPEEQREVITLAHLAGLSRADIGAEMGRSEEAVRALLHRAMARLAMLLDRGQG
jgi:RNA polymerase sigma-70 factor (ECF subfamily)